MPNNMEFLKKPILTEKASALTEKSSRFTFKVEHKANKLQIKQAIEKMYGVNILAINTMIVNGKLKSLARKSALSYKAQDNNILVLEDFSFDSIKTKNYINLVNALSLTGQKTLLVLPVQDNNIYLSSRNIQKVKVITADQLNTYDVLNCGKLLLTANTVKTLEEAFAK